MEANYFFSCDLVQNRLDLFLNIGFESWDAMVFQNMLSRLFGPGEHIGGFVFIPLVVTSRV